MNIRNVLPPGFQSDPGIAQAVGSGLDSISSGIQSAAKTSGPAEVSDWLETFSSNFSPLESEPPPSGGFADAGAVSSAEIYFRSAAAAGDANGFTDFDSIDQISNKLSDSSFDYQSALQNFADILKNVELGGSLAPMSAPLEDTSAKLQANVQELAGEAAPGINAGDAEQWIDIRPGSLGDALQEKWIDLGSASIGDALQEKWIDSHVSPGDLGSIKQGWIDIRPETGWIDIGAKTGWSDIGSQTAWIDVQHDAGVSVTSPGFNTNESFQLDSISDSEILERFQYLQGTLQEIVDLNQGN